MEMHLHIISKKQAKELGMKWFFTGKPCARGHYAQRNMRSECYECKSARNKKWKEDNKEYNERYQEKYREQNREYFREFSNRWWRENKEQAYAYRRERARKKKERTLKFRDELLALVNKQRERELRALAKQYEEWTGEKFEVDHILPLLGREVSGLHWYGNLQLLPMTLNRRKREFHWKDAD